MADAGTASLATGPGAGGHLARRIGGERAFAAGLALAGIVGVVEGLGYGFLREDGIIGPGFLPIIAGAVLTALSIVNFVQAGRPRELDAEELAVLALQQQASEEAATAPVLTETGEGSERSAVIVYIGTGLALVAAQWIGLTLALSILVLLILLFIEKMGVVKSVTATVIIGFGTWLVFDHFLQVPIGFGLLGPAS